MMFSSSGLLRAAGLCSSSSKPRNISRDDNDIAGLASFLDLKVQLVTPSSQSSHCFLIWVFSSPILCSFLRRLSQETMPDWTMALLPGFVFHPLDEHLLDFYLRKKILGETLLGGIIVEADVYGDDPKNLTARYNMANRDSEWFFFASRTRRHPGAEDSKRVSRSAGLGRWKATQGIKTVLDSKRKVLNGISKETLYP
ncbi:NAC domain-containing protein 96-like [Phoenix dactylifera]|uniref:NAC domain-containing protein 96-like n=1 Tax=Phoenix dactylifera TaxID=42345 RepID=A0A8B9AJD3_PHODC|nr:NAC domain-containing protein 96-like [Phoenix dactylifera]